MAEAVDTVHYIDAERVAAVRAAQIDDLLLRDLAATFHALGDPTRVKLIFALSRAELCVCDLAALLEVSVSAVSHQLRLLRSLRLVRTRREGKLIYYTLDDDHIRTLFAQGLAHVKHQAPVSVDEKSEEESGHQEPVAAGAAARR